MTMVMVQLLVTWLPFYVVVRKCDPQTRTIFRMNCLRNGHLPPGLLSVKIGSVVSPPVVRNCLKSQYQYRVIYCLAVLKTTNSLTQVLLLSVLSCWSDPRILRFRVVTMFGRMLISVTRSAFWRNYLVITKKFVLLNVLMETI